MTEKKQPTLSYWKEFWYKRINGIKKGEAPLYIPNTRKFWATVSWIILLVWMTALIVYIMATLYRWLLVDKTIAIDKLPWGYLATITGTLIGNAQVAVGWYSYSKANDKEGK